MTGKIIGLIVISLLPFNVLFISVSSPETISPAQVSQNDNAYVPESVIILLKSDLDNILPDDLRVNKKYGSNEERALLKDIAVTEKNILKTNILIIEQNNKIIHLLQELNKNK